MDAFAVETKMHYPVMTEQQVAARWKVSLKTMRRWRQDKVGPTWHKLFHHVRYHEADSSSPDQLLFERGLMVGQMEPNFPSPANTVSMEDAVQQRQGEAVLSVEG